MLNVGVIVVDDSLKIKIDGDLADEHMVPIYEIGESLAGVGLSFTRVAHFLLTSEVKYRKPYDNRILILTKAPKAGSVDFGLISLLQGAAPTTMFGQLALGVTSGLVVSFGLYLIDRIIGRERHDPPEPMRPIVDNRSGDVDALGASIVAPMQRAHTIIQQGANSISIQGKGHTIILNSETRDFLKTTIKTDEDYWIDVSIGRLDANAGTGGAFVFEHGRIIPFNLSEHVTDEARRVIAKSHSDYFVGRKEQSKIEIRVMPSVDISGKVKSYFLIDAKEVDEIE